MHQLFEDNRGWAGRVYCHTTEQDNTRGLKLFEKTTYNRWPWSQIYQWSRLNDGLSGFYVDFQACLDALCFERTWFLSGGTWTSVSVSVSPSLNYSINWHEQTFRFHWRWILITKLLTFPSASVWLCVTFCVTLPSVCTVALPCSSKHLSVLIIAQQNH